MRFVACLLARAAIVLLLVGRAGAATLPSYGGTQASPIICIDLSGNYAGCGGTGGSASTANQGTAAAIAGAWPMYLALGGAALGPGNPLPMQMIVAGAAASGANPVPTADGLADIALGTPTDTAAAVGGNGSAIAQLKQAVTQLSTQVTRLNTIITTLGSPFQAGGSIGNTSFAATQAGAPWSFNWTQLAGTALGAPTAYGTPPSGNVPGVNANVTSAALPPGAATAANQLGVIAYADYDVGPLAASTNTTQGSHPLPSPAIYSKFNAFFRSDQAGTYFVQGSTDNFATKTVTILTGSIAANVPANYTIPIMYPYHRAFITNGGTAATAVSVASSYTAN